MSKYDAKAVINHCGIPFEARGPKPNSMTITAFEELEFGQDHKTEPVEELFADLEIGKLGDV